MDLFDRYGRDNLPNFVQTVLGEGEIHFSDLEKVSGEKSKFFQHLNQSRVEFLKAIRSLVDERIESLEKKDSPKAGKKMTKIKVE